MNKTIFMTYKQDIPNKVRERWLEYNSNYNIDLSLDCDCERFLLDNFNNNIYNLFKSIDKGMYKADLWRYCKLYKNTGVYADVDLKIFPQNGVELGYLKRYMMKKLPPSLVVVGKYT